MKTLWRFSVLRIMPVHRVYPEEHSLSTYLFNLPVWAQLNFIKISISATQSWLNILPTFSKRKECN